MLTKFLRYNGRHYLYWKKGNRPVFNPMSSSSSDEMWFKGHEPSWLFNLRQRWFCFAGAQRCGRRGESWHGAKDTNPAPDTWDIGPDGNRTCSYCGSIHFDDMMKIARLALEDERYGIEGTTKSYKVYVKQPGVRNAGEGAIKFYMHHCPENPTPEQQQLFSDAKRITWQRFEQRFRQHQTP